MTTFERVKRTVVESLCCEEQEVTPTTSLVDLGAESIDFLDIVFRLENEFTGLSLSTDELIPLGERTNEAIKSFTVGMLVAAVEERIGKQGMTIHAGPQDSLPSETFWSSSQTGNK